LSTGLSGKNPNRHPRAPRVQIQIRLHERKLGTHLFKKNLTRISTLSSHVRWQNPMRHRVVSKWDQTGRGCSTIAGGCFYV